MGASLGLSNGMLAIPITHIGPGAPGDSFGSIGVDAVEPDDLTEIPSDETVREVRKSITLSPPEIELSEDAEKRLVNYLVSELSQCEMERSEYMRDFARWKRKYRTKFPEFPKDWPLANSSQLTVPVIKTAVHTLTSRVYQTVMAADPILSIRTKNPDYQDFVEGYEEFLELYNKERLDLEDVLDTITTETIKMGTAIAEVTTKKDKKNVVTFDGLSNTYKKSLKTIYDGPVVYHVPIEDFWIRVAYQDPQKAPWCGKAVRKTWSEIKDMAAGGQLDPDCIDKIWRLPENPGTRPEPLKAEERIENREPYGWQEYRLFELAIRWDFDGDGFDEEAIVYFHWESRTLLRRKFNTFRNGRRPWIVFRYIRVEHRMYGEGVCEILEHLQEEISTIHNQRIDNATVANLQIILVKKLIRGLSPGDRLWSGKIVKADQADVGTLRLGEIYPSTVENENISYGYARELSGAGEVATGQAQPVTRTTATAQLSLLEEMNRRFDKPIKSIRKAIREIGVHVTDLLVDHGTNGLAEAWLGDERGQEVEQMLADPLTFQPGNATLQVTSTKSTVNKEVEFQSAIAVMNMVVQMGEQMMNVANAAGPQYGLIIAHELVDAIKAPWRKVMEYSDPTNVDKATAVLSVLSRILPAPEDMGGMAQADANANASAATAALQGGGTATGGARQLGNGGTSAAAANEARMAAVLAAARGNVGRNPSMGPAVGPQ